MAIKKRILGGSSKAAPSPLQTSAKKIDVFAGGEIAALNASVNKKHSKNTLRTASDRRADYGRQRTGILTLDLGLAGGWKLSRGHMIYGERSSGKSTLAQITVARFLEDNPTMCAVWVDVEGTFDRVWAEALGVDTDRLLVLEPDTGEDALDLVDAYLQVREVGIVVTDSIAFITPQKEIQESVEKNLMGQHALLIGKFLRKVNSAVIRERKRDHHVISLYLNQFRMKIGVMFGDPRTLPGGKALEFAVSQNVQMSNKEILSKGKAQTDDDAGGDGSTETGTVLFNEHTFKITKDKTGGRIKEGVFKLIRDPSTGFPSGYIEQSRTIISFAQSAGLYEGNKRTHSFEGINHKFVGIDEVQRYFFENQRAQRELCDKIVKVYCRKWGLEG